MEFVGDFHILRIPDEQSFLIANKCHECNSSEDSNCRGSPNLWSKACQSESRQCYTLTSGDAVIRGCVGDDFIPSPEECSDPFQCSICSDKNKCNDRAIGTEKCISIDGNGNPSGVGSSVICPLDIEPMGCYHYVYENNTTIEKGCFSKLSPDLRAECVSSKYCRNCLGENCNHLERFPSCFVCDSTNNSSCLSLDKTYETEMCDNYQNQCFTYTDGRSVIRNCLEDMNQSFIISCKNAGDSKCSLCQEPGCNDRSIVDKCVSCVSDNERLCRDNVELLNQTICSLSPLSSGCYLDDNDSTISRGCVNQLTAKQRKKCLKQSKTCQTCFQPGCNQKDKFQQKCIICHGDEDDDCASTQNDQNTVHCLDYSASCLVGIDVDGFTHRQCSKNGSGDAHEFQLGYELCFREECNDGVYPNDRLQCYHCDGDADCTFKNTNSTTKEELLYACNLYQDDDQCFTAYGEGEIIHLIIPDEKVFRGCLSDESEISNACKKSPDSCKMCRESGCNDHMKSNNKSNSLGLWIGIIIVGVILIVLIGILVYKRCR